MALKYYDIVTGYSYSVSFFFLNFLIFTVWCAAKTNAAGWIIPAEQKMQMLAFFRWKVSKCINSSNVLLYNLEIIVAYFTYSTFILHYLYI